MKIQIYNWCREAAAAEALARLGRKHGDELEGDPLELARVFFEAGLNVMLLRGEAGSAVVAVDVKTFTQR